jgi:hypothetical protein
MTEHDCERSNELIATLGDGPFTDDQLVHIHNCPLCQDSILVYRYLAEPGFVPDLGEALPPAGQIWWRAQIRERQTLAKRSVVPIDIVQTVGLAAAIVLFTICFVLWGRSQSGEAPPVGLLLIGSAAIVTICSGITLYIWARARN